MLFINLVGKVINWKYWFIESVQSLQTTQKHQCHSEDLKLFHDESLYHRIQSIDLQSKSVDWFLYDKNLLHEKIKLWTYSAS